MQFTKATIIAFAALLSTSFAAPSGSCADKATSCRSSGGTNCDQDAKACCDQIQVVSPKSDGDHYQCYQDSGIGNLLQSKRDVGDDCASKAKACRSSGGANCDDQAQTCCDQIQVVSPSPTATTTSATRTPALEAVFPSATLVTTAPPPPRRAAAPVAPTAISRLRPAAIRFRSSLPSRMVTTTSATRTLASAACFLSERGIAVRHDDRGRRKQRWIRVLDTNYVGSKKM